MTRTRRMRLTAGLTVSMVLAMTAMAYAAVPLYDLFCRVTGFGGTPGIAASAPDVIGDKVITVRFNADTQSALPWQFRPTQQSVELRVGESGLAFYEAQNLGETSAVGTATFNVTPLKAAAYFNKVDCFCFTEQYLAAGARADLPVSFHIDPAIVDDPETAEISTITLSYMFFNAGDEARDRFEAAALDAASNRSGVN